MERLPPLPPSYGDRALEAPQRISRLIALSSLLIAMTASALLYYLYTVKGDKELLAAALIFLVIGVMDVFIMSAVLDQALSTVRSLAVKLVSKVSPRSYGIAVDASLAMVVSMEVPGGVLAARVGGKGVEVLLVESPRVLAVKPWPGIPLRLIKYSFAPKPKLTFTRCLFKSGSRDARVYIPSPSRREIWLVEGTVRYAFKYCPYQIGERDLEEVLVAIGF